MIRNTLLVAAAALALTMGAAMSETVTRADIGASVRDASGATIGSLKAIQGDTAVVWIGYFNTPGNHLITVKLTEISSHDGQLVLNDAATTQFAARKSDKARPAF